MSAAPEDRAAAAPQVTTTNPLDEDADLITVIVAGTKYRVRFSTAELIERIALDEIRDLAQEKHL